jgi:hypothetical protein
VDGVDERVEDLFSDRLKGKIKSTWGRSSSSMAVAHAFELARLRLLIAGNKKKN